MAPTIRIGHRTNIRPMTYKKAIGVVEMSQGASLRTYANGCSKNSIKAISTLCKTEGFFSAIWALVGLVIEFMISPLAYNAVATDRLG